MENFGAESCRSRTGARQHESGLCIRGRMLKYILQNSHIYYRIRDLRLMFARGARRAVSPPIQRRDEPDAATCVGRLTAPVAGARRGPSLNATHALRDCDASGINGNRDWSAHAIGAHMRRDDSVGNVATFGGDLYLRAPRVRCGADNACRSRAKRGRAASAASAPCPARPAPGDDAPFAAIRPKRRRRTARPRSSPHAAGGEQGAHERMRPRMGGDEEGGQGLRYPLARLREAVPHALIPSRDIGRCHPGWRTQASRRSHARRGCGSSCRTTRSK